MLAGEGFRDVINLSGGIKAWNSHTAVGPVDLGLDLFSGKESPPETLTVAYLLEEGLRDFYLSMAPKVTDGNTRRLFEKLSAIEAKHQDRIFKEYVRITGTAATREDFMKEAVTPAMEGGLTTEEYLNATRRTLTSRGRSLRLPCPSRPRRSIFTIARPTGPKARRAETFWPGSPTRSAPI